MVERVLELFTPTSELFYPIILIFLGTKWNVLVMTMLYCFFQVDDSFLFLLVIINEGRRAGHV